MKKQLLLLLLALSLTSCAAQTPKPTQYITIPVTVNTIAGGEITLQTESGHLLLTKPNPEVYTIPDNLKLEEGRSYLVSFRYLECKNCFKKRVKLVGFITAPAQARKDAAVLETRYRLIRD